jgi:hypothetical protein
MLLIELARPIEDFSLLQSISRGDATPSAAIGILHSPQRPSAAGPQPNDGTRGYGNAANVSIFAARKEFKRLGSFSSPGATILTRPRSGHIE